jgi:hypothetical protein
MSQAPGFLGSSIGRKVIMAVTGLVDRGAFEPDHGRLPQGHPR